VAEVAAHTRLQFDLVLQHEPHTLVGFAGLAAIDAHNSSASFGIILHHEYWGQGYATEVAEVLLAYGTD